MSGSTTPVSFRGYALDLPRTWTVEVGERQVLAAPPTDGTFLRNVVVQVIPADGEPTVDLKQIGGAVVLERQHTAGALPAERIVFGYPLPITAVTAVQLVGEPTPDGRLLVTYSDDATRFPDHWPEAQEILRSVRRTP